MEGGEVTTAKHAESNTMNQNSDKAGAAAYRVEGIQGRSTAWTIIGKERESMRELEAYRQDSEAVTLYSEPDLGTTRYTARQKRRRRASIGDTVSLESMFWRPSTAAMVSPTEAPTPRVRASNTVESFFTPSSQQSRNRNGNVRGGLGDIISEVDEFEEKEAQFRGSFLCRALSGIAAWYHLWLLLFSVGVSSAATGNLVDNLTTMCHDFKMFLFETNGIENDALRFTIWVSYGVCLVTFGVWFNHYVSNGAASGSGIPQMKAIMAGAEIPQALTFRTLIAKGVSLSACLGSGLSIGKEGPWVHFSAVLAQQLCQTSFFKHLVPTDGARLKILSAGFAAGTAANFGAPIGGVLFSIEVTA